MLKSAPQDSENYLVWKVDLYQQFPPVHEIYFIDAHTGELVQQITGLQNAIDRDVYDCSSAADSKNCYLDFDTGSYVEGRSEGQPVRGENPTYGGTDVDDMYDYLGGIHNYYSDAFGRDGANELGGMSDGTDYAETSTTGFAYLDGVLTGWLLCPNAFFDKEGSLNFCEQFVTPDITGHEYAHAVDYFAITDDAGDYAGLTYQDESGALNESNSDVFGEAYEYYNAGSNNWELGEDLPTGALRSMADPSAYSYNVGSGSTPYPDRFYSENLYCGTSDSGGVHVNSSVPNHAAYLMAMGGTFNTCTIEAIGQEKEEAIFYRALTEYYTTSTDFNDAYSALISSCEDLYGAGNDCAQVRKALMAVEMDQAGYCSAEVAVAPDCASIDNAPTITAVSSDKADGYYKKGAVIDIDVTFSEAVTSTGEVTVVLETGSTDRTCAFEVVSTTTGTCNYTVQSGDSSADLAVKSITGTITNDLGDAMLNYEPASGLDDTKALVIDTEKPKVPTKVKVFTSKSKKKLIKGLNPKKFSKVVKHKDDNVYITWKKSTDNLSGVKSYYVKFTNKNIKKKVLLRSKNKKSSTNRKLKGKIRKPNKQYKLYMIVKDKAGNKSKKKRLLRYKVQSS